MSNSFRIEATYGVHQKWKEESISRREAASKSKKSEKNEILECDKYPVELKKHVLDTNECFLKERGKEGGKDDGNKVGTQWTNERQRHEKSCMLGWGVCN